MSPVLRSTDQVFYRMSVTWAATVWMFLSSQHAYPNLQCDGIILMIGISALIEEASIEFPSPFHQVRIHEVFSSEEGDHTQPWWEPDLGLLAHRPVKNKCLFISHPVCGILLELPKWTKTWGLSLVFSWLNSGDRFGERYQGGEVPFSSHCNMLSASLITANAV